MLRRQNERSYDEWKVFLVIIQSSPGQGLTRHSGVRVLARLTQSRIKHVERHLVALLRTGNGDQALVVVVLGFVDLDDTAAQLAYFVDLGTALSDDGTDHVVGNEDLLGDGLSGECGTTLHRLLWRSRAWLCGSSVAVRLRLLRASTDIRCTGRASAVGHLTLGMLHRRLALLVGHGVLGSRGASSGKSRLLVLTGVAHLTASVLRNIRNYLHAARDNTLRTTVTDSIRRSCWSAEALSQLLDKRATDIVGGNVDSISDTKYNERALCRQRQTRFRGVQTCTGSFLNLANSDTLLSNDGADQDVRNKQAKRIGL